ncbi:MAG TPA: APC family permease [Nitrososphaerales archaeon]|nr:APC family permease [Nitrososphaerales archaeon]
MSQSQEESPNELKREIGIWGSFSMGYADVGADIYVVLGVIAFFAGVASPLAFLLAATTYVCTGLCYAELATAYPVAGGGQFYSMKAFGPFHGFVAGWGLMLDYTIDIALFALATVGYVGFITNFLYHSTFLLQSPYYVLVAVSLILLLLVLNIIGIKYSSKLNEFIVALGLVTVGIFLIFGLPSIVASGALALWVSTIVSSFTAGSFGPNTNYSSFVYAVSLATASYIGIESISQAAEETKRPSQVIPKATRAAIISVVVVAVSLSLLSVTLTSPFSTGGVVNNQQSPAVSLAGSLPIIGGFFALFVAVIGVLTCYISTNTGVIGVSRVTFSMGRLGLMPRGFARVSSRFRTPYVTILLFSAIACVLLLVNLALPGPALLGLVTSMYNFGALVAYMYVNSAAIVLRFKDPERKGWKMPLNFGVSRGGKQYSVPVIPFVGFASSAIVWLLLVGFHPIGRVVGAIWFAIGIAGYLIYRKRKGVRKVDV